MNDMSVDQALKYAQEYEEQEYLSHPYLVANALAAEVRRLRSALTAQGAGEPLLARHQPCGCIVCTCDDPDYCHGCGAKHCGTHPLGEMPNPRYRQQPAAQGVGEAEPYRWLYEINHAYECITKEKPPEDAYDEGTLIPLFRRPPASASDSADRMAYEGCREDLLDWKRRALRAEAVVTVLHEKGLITSNRQPPPASAFRPRIICLCGSTKFIDTFAIKTWELEREGHIVLGCTLLPKWYCGVPSHFGEATGTKAQCDELHLKKIDLADEVLILNVHGYIGESTCNEIAYATKTGKPVRYLVPLPPPPEKGET